MAPPKIMASDSLRRAVVGRVEGRDAVAVGRPQDAVAQGLGEDGIQRGLGGGQQARSRGDRIGVVDEAVRHLQTEHRERLGAGRSQLLAEDRRVGQRVAVDLDGERFGDESSGCRHVSGIQLGHGLVDVESTREGGLGGHRFVAQTWQAREQHVHLDLCTLRRFGAGRR